MKHVIAIPGIFLMLLLAACASSSKDSIAPGTGSGFDASTTYIGLTQTAATEANPLLGFGDPLTVAVGSVVLKQGIKYSAVNFLGADEEVVDTNVETAGVAAGMWNLGVIANVHPAGALAAAAISAYSYYRHRTKKPQAWVHAPQALDPSRETTPEYAAAVAQIRREAEALKEFHVVAAAE